MNFNAAEISTEWLLIYLLYEFYVTWQLYWITFNLEELSTEWLLT